MADDSAATHDQRQRSYAASLAESLGWPAMSLGLRSVNGRDIPVGVPAGRAAWATACRLWPRRLLAELIARLEDLRLEAALEG